MQFTERQAYMFRSRFGLDDGKAKTLDAIGREFGITRERVRQIISRCLGELRRISFRINNKMESASFSEDFFTSIRSIIRDDAYSLEQNLDFIHESYFSHLPKVTHYYPLVVAISFNKSEESRVKEELANYKKQCLYDSRTTSIVERFSNILKHLELSPENNGSINVSKAREIKGCEWAEHGVFYSELLKRDVEYESNLELNFCLMLERSQMVDSYQEQPVKIGYSWFGRRYVYYPDFYVSLKSGLNVLFEIKPIQHMAIGINLAKWEALKEYSLKQRISCCYTNGHKTYNEIKSIKPAPGFVSELLEIIDSKGSVDLEFYKVVKNKYDASTYDLISFISNHSILFELRPFRLSKRVSIRSYK